MRASPRSLPILTLWLAAAFPFALIAIDRVSPVAAVEFALASGRTLHAAAVWGGAGALVLALLFPPFPAGIRLLLRSTIDHLRIDRQPLLRALAELRHLETATRHLEAGRAALAIGEADLAHGHLMRAIELEPDLVEAHYRLGLARMRLGRPDLAIAPLALAEAHQPGIAFGDALLQLGRCHMLLKDDANAAELLRRHAAMHGGNRRSHYWLGACLRTTGDQEGARAAFATAAAPPPQRPRLTAAEAFFRARARVALWHGGRR